MKNELRIGIQNMVCPRCISAVEVILNRLKIPFRKVEIGFVDLQEVLVANQIDQFSEELEKIGFLLLVNNESKKIELLKRKIIAYIDLPSPKKINLSTFILNEFPNNYTYLSTLFVENTGVSIEKFHIEERIKRVKYLLNNGTKNITEIADLLGFSSVQHLSSQFKKICGVTLRDYQNEIKANKI